METLSGLIRVKRREEGLSVPGDALRRKKQDTSGGFQEYEEERGTAARRSGFVDNGV
ncbi:hypothetical protein [Oxalobacter paraformigenes]|uniref:Uncharacterized protein n=1 Tax=Oxalobacter paraformigenes TaxID=556268 RepID=C3X3G9_9BURK|nr:hypothetical protein [Oxalobacter paraformigenes]EEO27755.1 hypothetical protein OFAG_00908 [Oxalobacter paraformigenes]